MVDKEKLPADFPTHKHSPEFWEALGRTVATFGFLEDTLARAIFSFTGTRRISLDQEETAFEKWLLTLEKALSDPLGGLIDSYGKAVRANSCARTANLDDLLKALREAAVMRNVLCHGFLESAGYRKAISSILRQHKKGGVSNTHGHCRPKADAEGRR